MKKSTDDLLAEFTDMLNEDRTQSELEAFIGCNDQDREFVHLARTAWRLNQELHKQSGVMRRLSEGTLEEIKAELDRNRDAVDRSFEEDAGFLRHLLAEGTCPICGQSSHSFDCR